MVQRLLHEHVRTGYPKARLIFYVLTNVSSYIKMYIFVILGLSEFVLLLIHICLCIIHIHADTITVSTLVFFQKKYKQR